MYLYLSQFSVLFYALSVAFVVVHLIPRIKLTARKPFNCLKCMTGWSALTLALFAGYGWFALLLMMAGLFIGAIVEGIIMRWL